ncbi:hypothetical protein HanIR_Chr09g0429101 [Helianthus annuus]|nr:hypothetical protein HanIR_Chr09g0429101 [Helianthus annuus]
MHIIFSVAILSNFKTLIAQNRYFKFGFFQFFETKLGYILMFVTFKKLYPLRTGYLFISMTHVFYTNHILNPQVINQLYQLTISRYVVS